jgi:hypothetical protein
MMAMANPIDTSTAAIWGDLFEVGVKRGCLGYLASAGLLPPGGAATWTEMRVEQLHAYLREHLDIIDRAEQVRHSSTLNHLLLQGWGLGWTAMREGLKRLGSETLRTEGLFCPLHLPGRRTANQPVVFSQAQLVEEFWAAMHLDGRPDLRWADRGEPANADFFLWLSDGNDHHVLAVEFSANTPATAEDYADSLPNLLELLRHARRLEGRGVFTRIGATLTDEQFVFSERIVSHLSAFTTKDKPLYKLCQASSYATRFLRLMARRGTPVPSAAAHAIAITNNGVEALRAEATSDQHPRWKLMVTLGTAYRDTQKLDEDNPIAIDDEIRIVRTQIVQGLPRSFRDRVAETLDASHPATGLDLHLSEQLQHIINPAVPVGCDGFLAGVDESRAVCRLLGMEQPRARLRAMTATNGQTTLRDVHAAVIQQAVEAAQPGRITVIGAEGSPGIGKTTAVMNALKALEGGFLWLYASPRLVINGHVTQEMARLADGSHSGVLTLGSNAKLISGAGPWWRHQHPYDRRKVEAAVAVDGVAHLDELPGSTILVTPHQGAEIEARFSGTSMQKYTLDEDTDRLNREQTPGVLETLARATHAILARHPDQQRVVITASIQGFRTLLQADARRSARDTVERLSSYSKLVPRSQVAPRNVDASPSAFPPLW